jgi:hypothetical protein
LSYDDPSQPTLQQPYGPERMPIRLSAADVSVEQPRHFAAIEQAADAGPRSEYFVPEDVPIGVANPLANGDRKPALRERG